MFNSPIFRSRRFVGAVVGLILMIAITYLPQLAPFEDQLVKQITDLILALIAGYSITDVLSGWLDKS